MRAQTLALSAVVALLLQATAHAQPNAASDTASSAASNAAWDPAQLLGEWWTPGFNARVRVDPCGEAVCGRIVWAWDETPQDIADKRPLVGRKVIEGMRPGGGPRWAGGRLYNPQDGRDYEGSLTLQSSTRLLVEGCVLFVCQKQLWRRVDAGRCPPIAMPG